MGKWTPDYYDDVLHHKLKTIVSASIRRTALEKSESEPTISYETFIEDLDAGDSFTTTVIDVLVKELADRRNRSTATESDKKRVSERTARSLRSIISDSQIFRPRRLRRVISEVARSPSQQVVDLDDEDFEGFLDASGNINMEGVRQNPVYEAYNSDGAWADEWATSLVRTSSPDPLGIDALSMPNTLPASSPPPQPPRRNITSHSHSLTRQPSIRRPTRSRTVDFNDFTSRRRSATRDLSIRDSLRESMDLYSASTDIEQDPGRSGSAASSSTRRFFPLGRNSRRHEPRAHIPPAWLFGTASSRQSSTDREVSLRAPESMLSRHASPIPAALPSPVSLADTPVGEHGVAAES
ncbi:hypothetical protein BDZ89DRAFT_1071379 [Hymenopellis radicata]|nr:hypothetical protein BDZ89DRAFT_1071379 [Hymenopellis radicata]